MVRACVYEVTATCDVSGVKTLRRYFGVFKVFSNQTRESAQQSRERRHAERPVAWIRGADPATVSLRAIGHPMELERALAAEAIMTADSFEDGGAPSRGGPWSHPRLGSVGIAEAAEVHRLASFAGSLEEARQSVLSFARGSLFLSNNAIIIPNLVSVTLGPFFEQ